jgi:hypothetical protein
MCDLILHQHIEIDGRGRGGEASTEIVGELNVDDLMC